MWFESPTREEHKIPNPPIYEQVKRDFAEFRNFRIELIDPETTHYFVACDIMGCQVRFGGGDFETVWQKALVLGWTTNDHFISGQHYCPTHRIDRASKTVKHGGSRRK